jgi:riboflavin kinase/FMN adenylyltransferase
MKTLRWDLLGTEESSDLLEKLCAGKRGTALTIGGFDGPHRGHQALFDAVLTEAREHNLCPGIVTFSRSPRSITGGDSYPGDVSTLALRLSRFQEIGFALAVLIDFSADFGKMSGSVFFDILVKTVRMRYVAVGHDFRCGHRLDTGVGEIELLSREKGFRFDSIRQIELDGLRISSSSVRNAIHSADFALAERLLGHPFSLDFTDVGWDLTGRYPEAALASFTQILPRRGRYRVTISMTHGAEARATLEIGDTIARLEWLPGSVTCDPRDIATARF